jgi:hypothetical protein
MKQRLYFTDIWRANQYAFDNKIENYSFEPAKLGVGVYLCIN